MSTYNRITITVPMGDDAVSSPEDVQKFLLNVLKSVPLPEEDTTIAARDVNGNKQLIEVRYDKDPEPEYVYEFRVQETRVATCVYQVRARTWEEAEAKVKEGKHENDTDDVEFEFQKAVIGDRLGSSPADD